MQDLMLQSISYNIRLRLAIKLTDEVITTDPACTRNQAKQRAYSPKSASDQIKLSMSSEILPKTHANEEMARLV